MQKTTENVDDWLADDPDLVKLDAIIREKLPGSDRVLWRGVFWGGTEQAIVGYDSIQQPRPKGEPVEWFLIGLARQKQHISVYVNAVEDGEYLIHRYAGDLGTVKIGSASIGFRKLDDLDLTVFGDILERARELSTA